LIKRRGTSNQITKNLLRKEEQEIELQNIDQEEENRQLTQD
jgi:hypothetical protein